MNQEPTNLLFPGQQTGKIRVLIKTSDQEDSIQLHLDFFEDQSTQK